MRIRLSPLLFCAPAMAFALEIPQPGPDSRPQAGVPEGEISKKTFTQSRIFAGTNRDYWVYVPKQYSPEKPANLIVFQDGGGYVKADGASRAPVVLDNLIAKGELPPTVAVFVSPGTIPGAKPGAASRSNRSFEYDSMGDRYTRFLVEELLPDALEGLKIMQAICGSDRRPMPDNKEQRGSRVGETRICQQRLSQTSPQTPQFKSHHACTCLSGTF
jgi:enterochelin esterase-like enzyme